MNRGNTGFKSYFNDTLHQHNFDVGATFTFKDGKSISEHNAKYLLKLFLNELSEVYFGKHRDRNNVHVERVVFMHRKNSDNRKFIHFHIALKSVGNKDTFKLAVRKVWERHVYNGQDVHFEGVNAGFGIYGLHEQQNWNSEELVGTDNKGRQLVKDKNDGNWMHDLQHKDSGTSYYIRQQYSLDKHTNNRLSKLFCTKNKLIEVRKLLLQEQWNTLRDVQVNSAIASNIR